MNPNTYEDIIDLPHYTSMKHPRMNKELRAAQFSPFAALTGYEDAIIETGRITECQTELTNEEKLKINEVLKNVNSRIKSNPKVKITYFEKDNKKTGGKYLTILSNIKKINPTEKNIILTDKSKIEIEKIINIEEIL